MSYLRDEALRQWSRRQITSESWPQFEKVLRDITQDPANYISVASLRLKKAFEGERTVREFTNFLEELKEDIPKIGQE